MDGHSTRLKKLSMISAIDNRGKEQWIVNKGDFTKDKQSKFLKALLDQEKKHLFLILDNSDYYQEKNILHPISRVDRGKIEISPPPLCSPDPLIQEEEIWNIDDLMTPY